MMCLLGLQVQSQCDQTPQGPKLEIIGRPKTEAKTNLIA